MSSMPENGGGHEKDGCNGNFFPAAGGLRRPGRRAATARRQYVQFNPDGSVNSLLNGPDPEREPRRAR
jgi:hypothetical protein